MAFLMTLMVSAAPASEAAAQQAAARQAQLPETVRRSAAVLVQTADTGLE